MTLVLGSITALLGLILLAVIWFDRGEFYAAGLMPIVIGLIVSARGRQLRPDSASTRLEQGGQRRG